MSGLRDVLAVAYPSFTATPTTGAAPLTAQFIDASTGTITSRLWTFGDGQTGIERDPSHTYLQAGVYTVTLTVSGPGGSNTSTRTGYISVEPPSSEPLSVFLPVMAWLE